MPNIKQMKAQTPISFLLCYFAKSYLYSQSVFGSLKQWPLPSFGYWQWSTHRSSLHDFHLLEHKSVPSHLNLP